MRISLQDLDRYMFVDPAGKPKPGEGLKNRRARQAIVVIGVDFIYRVFLLYAWAGRLHATGFRDKIITVYDKWDPRACGIEANAMQELFADLVRDASVKQVGVSRIRPYFQPTGIDKDWRIRTRLEPVINQGRFFMMQGNAQLDAETEIARFPTYKQKDIVDAIATAVDMIPKKNKKAAMDEEAEEQLRHLRETGAPRWYIEQRAIELKKEVDMAVKARGDFNA